MLDALSRFPSVMLAGALMALGAASAGAIYYLVGRVLGTMRLLTDNQSQAIAKQIDGVGQKLDKMADSHATHGATLAVHGEKLSRHELEIMGVRDRVHSHANDVQRAMLDLTKTILDSTRKERKREGDE